MVCGATTIVNGDTYIVIPPGIGLRHLVESHNHHSINLWYNPTSDLSRLAPSGQSPRSTDNSRLTDLTVDVARAMREMNELPCVDLR